MGRARHRWPTWTQGPLSGLLRLALSVPLVAGPIASSEAAAALGRFWSRRGFNRTRFARAMAHLSQAFPEWDPPALERCARDSYEHLFRLGVEFCYTPRVVSEDGWPEHVEVPFERRDGVRSFIGGTDIDAGPALKILLSGHRCVMLTGHCGNWEFLGYSLAAVGFPTHALYRPLDNTALDRWVRDTRQRRGLVLLDKFGAAERMGPILARGGSVSFVADQNAGDRGLFVPYFGRLASSYKAIGLMAIQHRAPVICSMARRLRAEERRAGDHPFRYRLEVYDLIEPGAWETQPDPLFYLTARYRRALERMVRAAPEQYLWMHRMWKSRPRHERLGKPVPNALIDKLRALPWMTETDVARVVDDSNRLSRAAAGAIQ